MSRAAVPVLTRRIYAGKLRRYYGISLLRQLLDIPTTVKNIRDIVLVGIGVLQSMYYIWRWKPEVIFTKGGFVCFPVALVARLFRIALITHDSDMRPGLTNRIIAKWAKTIATGMPLQNYSYDRGKAHYVGVPIDDAFQPFTDQQQREAKHNFGFIDINKPLVVVTGGGQGARRINDAITAIAHSLVSDVNILHITGAGEFDRVSKSAPEIHGYTLVPFIHDGMAKVLGAADIVITRASATTLLEVASLAKPAIVIPSAVLGDQIKNAKAYAEMRAIIVIEEAELKKNPQVLMHEIRALLHDSKKRQSLSSRIHSLAKPDAAEQVANLIVAAQQTS